MIILNLIYKKKQMAIQLFYAAIMIKQKIDDISIKEQKKRTISL
jgi:hypothetical protein